MLTPTRGTDTSIYQIEIDWTALTGNDTGGSTILSYVLSYRKSTD